MRAGLLFDYLVDTIFDYPTPAEAYRVAALDTVNKLRAVAGLN
jgi:NAD(P) transhydrogenase